MFTVFRVALVFELVLVVLEELFPATFPFLPLGHTHCAQLGIVLVAAVVVLEVWLAIKEMSDLFSGRSGTDVNRSARRARSEVEKRKSHAAEPPHKVGKEPESEQAKPPNS